MDLETGAIADVELNFSDQRDAKSLVDHVLDAEERMNVAVGEPDVARVKTVVADMGYCDPAELRHLQEQGTRTAIADPVRNRRKDRLTAVERRALTHAQRTLRGASGRALVRRRGGAG